MWMKLNVNQMITNTSLQQSNEKINEADKKHFSLLMVHFKPLQFSFSAVV